MQEPSSNNEEAQPTKKRSEPSEMNLRRFFVFFLLAVVALYALGLNAHWRYHRDSLLYMGLGRSLAEDGSYRFNDSPHVFALPGLPAMLALVYLSVGESFLAMNILVSLFGIGCVILACFLMRELSLSSRQVMACVLLFGLSRSLYHYSAYVTTDAPFTFLVLVGLYCGVRMLRATGRASWHWCAAAGAAACAASLVRPLGPALLMGLLAGLWLKREAGESSRERLGKTALLLAPFLMLLGVWALRCVLVKGPDSKDYITLFVGRRSPVEHLEHALGVLPYYPASIAGAILGKRLGHVVGVLLFVPVLVGFVGSARRGEIVLCVYALVSLGALLLISPSQRYLLPLLPLMVYWLVLGAGWVATWLAQRRPPVSSRRASQLGYLLLGLILALNLGRIGKVIYEERSPNYYEVINEGRLVDYFDLADWLTENPRPDDTVFTREHRFLHYFSRVKAHRLKLSEKWTYPDWLAGFLKEAQVDYVVRDPRTEEWALPVDNILRAYPEAFEKEATVGRLELFRVRREKLGGRAGVLRLTVDGYGSSPSRSARACRWRWSSPQYCVVSHVQGLQRAGSVGACVMPFKSNAAHCRPLRLSLPSTLRFTCTLQRCHSAPWKCRATAARTVVPCDQDFNARHSYGRMGVDWSFGNTGFGQKAASVRRTVRSARETLSFCRNCPFADRSTGTASVEAFDLCKEAAERARWRGPNAMIPAPLSLSPGFLPEPR